MDELIAALDKNFEGEERMRQLLLNKAPKFGNDNEYVDGIYREMMHFIAENVQEWPDARGGRYSFNVHSQTVNVSHGMVCGATPDGRLAGEPFCDNASPMMGRDVKGPTATVKSVAAMGRAIVKKFTDNGAKAVLMDIREDAARRSAELLGLYEEHGFIVAGDVSSEESVKAAVQKVMDKYGRIDCLVNLAGIEGPNNSRTEDYDFKMAKKVFEINVYGTFLMMQNVLPIMQAQKSGAIVNFGSVSGMFGYAGEIAYGASKAAVIHMTKNAANENGGNGVRVNAISPGWVNTEMFRRILEQYKETYENPLDNVTLGPMNRPGEPMEMANVVVFLCSDEASYVNGSNFLVDGGMTLG